VSFTAGMRFVNAVTDRPGYNYFDEQAGVEQVTLDKDCVRDDRYIIIAFIILPTKHFRIY